MFKIMNLKQDGQKLRSQIVQDPEKLKKVHLHANRGHYQTFAYLPHPLASKRLQAIIDMEEQVEIEKKTISDAEGKARGATRC
jgi:hypothetical protein